MKMNFCKEARNVKMIVGSNNLCIDGVSTPSEIISTFENKFVGVLNDPDSPTAHLSTVSAYRAFTQSLFLH